MNLATEDEIVPPI